MPTAGILCWKRSKYWKPILHSSKSPETPRKLFLESIRIIERKKYHGAPHPGHEGGGRAHPYWACPLSRGAPGGPPVPIFCYMKAFTLEKIHKQAYGTKLRRHEAEPWRNQSRVLAGLFCRETSLQEGEIITIVITNDPLIGRGSISINIFTSTISSQTLVHLLYPILYPKRQIGTCWLLVVLITPCS